MTTSPYAPPDLPGARSARSARPATGGPGRVVLRTWAWGWLAAAQLVLDLLLAGIYLSVVAVLVSGVASIPALLVGVPLVAVCLWLAMVLARFERARVEAFVGVHIPAPPPPDRTLPLWRRLLLDARPWRASAHLTLIALWGIVAGAVTTALFSASFALAALPLYGGSLPGGSLLMPWGLRLGAHWWLTASAVFGLLVLPMVARGVVSVDVMLARWLLGGSHREEVQRLSARVETLTQTREAAVDSVELERRRIERDLHDGPQQRLVAIAMDLGMAQSKLDRDPAGARELLDKAHAASKEAITEMRQVARGIHPPVLTDRGLDAALSALAARSPVPVSVTVDLPRRPSPTVEAIAYFCVSEALTNVAKHSGARKATVAVAEQGGALVARIQDDGRGGADPGRGTGLLGLRQRVAAVDGTVDVASPPGGGTTVTVTLPATMPSGSTPMNGSTP